MTIFLENTLIMIDQFLSAIEDSVLKINKLVL